MFINKNNLNSCLNLIFTGGSSNGVSSLDTSYPVVDNVGFQSVDDEPREFVC